MQALAEEWRRRDREREALVKKKVESPHLPAQIHTTLTHHSIYCNISTPGFLLSSNLWLLVGGGV